jgi:hypothetical protein
MRAMFVGSSSTTSLARYQEDSDRWRKPRAARRLASWRSVTV